MNLTTPQIDDIIIWAASIIGGLTVIVGGGGAIWRLLLNPLRREIALVSEAICDVRKEVHPNHGSSLRDAVNSTRDRQLEIHLELKELRSRLDGHIEWHLDQPQ